MSLRRRPARGRRRNLSLEHALTDPKLRLGVALADRYRLVRELGQGGMATVYLAEDLKHHRNVAVKVLRSDLAAVIWAGRFLREVETTAQLHHPHILPLYDSGILETPEGGEGGVPYYVMPYVEGESLRARLDREKQLPLEEALRLTREVAEALAYAHAHGVVHRDIKPDNILLDSGHAVVADFGIAKALDAAGGEKLTATGIVIGTPRYMSPEQSMGEEALDGRSDLYSLACVLFEMLAGETPYSGPTAQAIIAKRMALPVPSVRMVRETVPEPVDRALTQALAKAPADRFATVGDFGTALVTGEGSTASYSRGGDRRTARRLGIAAVTVAVLATTLLVLRPWRSRVVPLEPNLLAVVPFDVTDEALTVWSEGVVDFLSRTLDGAGSLRTVAPSVVMTGWKGRSDRASATAVAERAGAGLAVTGNLSRIGVDSVAIRAELLDIAQASVLGDVAVSGPADRVGELVDSLGLGLLRALSRDRPVAAARRSAIGTAPLPALKAFLRGEQFYRRAMYDSALVAYQEGIERDSSFAFAWYRMAEVLGWTPVTAGLYDDAYYYAAQGHQRNRGQSTRDSLMIAAESAFVNAGPDRPDLFQLAYDRADRLTREFSRDPEAWYLAGEMRMHADRGFGRNETMAIEAFDRAVALDSSFAPPWEHLLELGLRHGGIERASRYALAFSTIPATTSATMTARLGGRLLLDTARLHDPALAADVAAASPTTLYRLAEDYFLNTPDSAETAVALLRQLDARSLREGESTTWIVDALMRRQYVAFALATRGHFREALEVDRRLITDPDASPFSWFRDPFPYLALFGVVPAAQAGAAYAPALEAGMSIPANGPRAIFGLPWWSVRRDTTSIRLFGRRMREARERTDSPAELTRTGYLEAVSLAYLALSRGDSVAALRQFGAVPDCPWTLDPVVCKDTWLTHATVLAARGEARRAATVLDSLLTTSVGVVAVLGRLERAVVAEALADDSTARRNYQFVLDAWRQADPELDPYVSRARDGLARVSGDKSLTGSTP